MVDFDHWMMSWEINLGATEEDLTCGSNKCDTGHDKP